jgi:hypothetical protein
MPLRPPRKRRGSGIRVRVLPARRRPGRSSSAGSQRAVVMWRAWWPWPWQQGALAAAVWLCLHVAARLMEALWWRPRRLERHFARQGVRGPGYRFFFGSSIALIRLMVDASSRRTTCYPGFSPSTAIGGTSTVSLPIMSRAPSSRRPFFSLL